MIKRTFKSAALAAIMLVGGAASANAQSIDSLSSSILDHTLGIHKPSPAKIDDPLVNTLGSCISTRVESAWYITAKHCINDHSDGAPAWIKTPEKKISGKSFSNPVEDIALIKADEESNVPIHSMKFDPIEVGQDVNFVFRDRSYGNNGHVPKTVTEPALYDTRQQCSGNTPADIACRNGDIAPMGANIYGNLPLPGDSGASVRDDEGNVIGVYRGARFNSLPELTDVSAPYRTFTGLSYAADWINNTLMANQ